MQQYFHMIHRFPIVGDSYLILFIVIEVSSREKVGYRNFSAKKFRFNFCRNTENFLTFDIVDELYESFGSKKYQSQSEVIEVLKNPLNFKNSNSETVKF